MITETSFDPFLPKPRNSLVALPDGWIQVKLASIADIRFSGVDKKSSPGEKPVFLCNYMNVYNKEYVQGNENFMSATASESEILRFEINPGDVIITKDSETPDDIGIPAVVIAAPKNLICGYHLALIRPKQDQVVPVFLAKQLAHNRISRYFARLANGMTRYGLTTTVIENTPIWLPPIEEQRRIAKSLHTVDEAIQRTEQLIAKLKAIKQGLLHDLLTRGIDENGQLRDPIAHPEQFKDSPLGRIPKTWSYGPLGEYVHFMPGFGFPIELQGQQEGDFPFFKVSDMELVENYRYLIKANNYVSKNLATRKGWKPIPENSVVFAKVGAALLLNRRRITKCASLIDNNMMATISPKNITTGFLYWWMTVLDFGRLVQTTALPSVNQTQLGRVLVSFPGNGDEQARIVSYLDSQDSLIESEIAVFRKLQAIKKGLMHDLLTGKVRVDINKEGRENEDINHP